MNAEIPQHNRQPLAWFFVNGFSAITQTDR